MILDIKDRLVFSYRLCFCMVVKRSRDQCT